jgi:hypothetical protein
MKVNVVERIYRYLTLLTILLFSPKAIFSTNTDNNFHIVETIWYLVSPQTIPVYHGAPQ